MAEKMKMSGLFYFYVAYFTLWTQYINFIFKSFQCILLEFLLHAADIQLSDKKLVCGPSPV